MICIECQTDDGKHPQTDHMSVQEVIKLCRSYKCRACLRTDEEIESDAEKSHAEFMKTFESAHDWSKQ